MNCTNNNDTCFHYAATVALNHKGIGKKFAENMKIKPFINKYNSDGVNYRSGTGDLEKNFKMIMSRFLLIFFLLKQENISCQLFKTKFEV